MKLKTNVAGLTEKEVQKLEKLSLFKGKKVLDVIPFLKGHFDTGFILQFEGNLFLTAQDGEYGDDAFKILTSKEVKVKLELNKRR